MEIRKVNVSMLNPATYNPRRTLHQDDLRYKKLEKSLDEFGYIDPIVWNQRTGNIVGGHQRFSVLANRGLTELDVSVVDLDDLQEKALNIALNKISGEWDEDKLTDILMELSGEGMIDITGFSTIEFEELLGEVTEPDHGEESPNPSRDSNFHYQEQYGVIVMCDGETEQQRVYEQLQSMGYECRVVAT